MFKTKKHIAFAQKILALALPISLLISCTSSPPESPIHLFAESGWEASCPYLTKDDRGNIVLTWAEEDTSHTHSKIYFSISKNDGESFSTPQAIPYTNGIYPHGENLPKLVCTKNGRWIIAFGISNPTPGNAYTGLIKYVQSFDDSKTWQPAKQLVKDTASHDQRYFDMAVLPNGHIGIVWMDDRLKTKPEGSTLFFAETNDTSGFGTGTPLAYNLCPCCRTDIVVGDQHNIHLAFRQILQDSIRDIMHMVSMNGGKTFSQPKQVSDDHWVVRACPHSGPSMTCNSFGLHIAWYTLGGGQGIFYANSTDEGKDFSTRQQVSTEDASAKHAQITALPNGTIVIVWDAYPVNNIHAHDHIGVQVRDAQGKALHTFYIDDAGFDDSFPVVLPLDDDHVLIAYTQQNPHIIRVCSRIIPVSQ